MLVSIAVAVRLQHDCMGAIAWAIAIEAGDCMLPKARNRTDNAQKARYACYWP
jgi:hypothetical protein